MKIKVLIPLFSLGVVGLGVIGYTGFGLSFQQSEEPPMAPPQTVSVTRGDVRQTVTAPGQLVGTHIEEVHIAVSGQLYTVAVQPGQPVRAGDLLAVIDTGPLQDVLERAEQAVADAETARTEQISGAEDALETAQARLIQTQARYPNLASAQIQLQQAATALVDAEVINSEAQQDATAAKKTLNQAEDDLEAARKAIKEPQATYDFTLAELESAQVELEEAQTALDEALDSDQSPAVIEVLEAEVEAAQAEVAALEVDLAAAAAALEPFQDMLDKAGADYDAALAEYEVLDAEADRAEGTLRDAPFAVQLAELNLESIKSNQLVADQDILLSEKEVERSQDALTEAQDQEIDSALLEAVEAADAALEAAILRAPFDGVVVEVHRQPGEVVREGESILTLMDPHALEAAVTVIEEDLPLVRPGQPVELFFDAAPDADTRGAVDRMIPVRVAGSDRPLFKVFIRLEGEHPDVLLAGMTVDSSIIVEQALDVLRLPRALVRAGSDSTTTLEVWANGQKTERTVTVGLRGDAFVEIVDGLQAGALVIAE